VKVVAETDSNLVFGIDMSIEGMRSRNYSIAIFILLILSLIFFSFIIYLYMPKGAKKLKTGEKVMFGALIAGIIIAVIIGYIQLIEGYLL
jgi:heme/copper-type cytochrome/quinol oxidase subunit 4